MAKRLLAVVGVIAVAVVLALLGWSTRALGPMTPAREIGLVLAIVGFLFWSLARFTLGKSFSVRAKATELVTHGIYSKIRNPVYVFGSVFIAGLILWLKQPSVLLVFVILIPIQIARARNEARVLEAKFGDAYRAYRAKTWF
jgi:protein-S-isoprenylcysteine O-methyltransferase Ste14